MGWWSRLGFSKNRKGPKKSVVAAKVTIAPGEERIGKWMKDHPPREEPAPTFLMAPEIPSMRPPPKPEHLPIKTPFKTPPDVSRTIRSSVLAGLIALVFLAAAAYTYFYK